MFRTLLLSAALAVGLTCAASAQTSSAASLSVSYDEVSTRAMMPIADACPWSPRKWGDSTCFARWRFAMYMTGRQKELTSDLGRSTISSSTWPEGQFNALKPVPLTEIAKYVGTIDAAFALLTIQDDDPRAAQRDKAALALAHAWTQAALRETMPNGLDRVTLLGLTGHCRALRIQNDDALAKARLFDGVWIIKRRYEDLSGATFDVRHQKQERLQAIQMAVAFCRPGSPADMLKGVVRHSGFHLSFGTGKPAALEVTLAALRGI